MNITRLFGGLQSLSSHLLQHTFKSIPFTRPLASLTGTISRTFLSGPQISSPLLPQAAKCQTSFQGLQGTNYWSYQPVRTKINYSRRTGGPRTVTAATKRFFRLHNGQWLRAQAGRRKRLWAKTNRRISRLQDHFMCNNAQSRLLDRMVGPRFKKPRHYPDDPYAVYHKFENLPHYKVLRNKPRFLP